MPSGTERLSVDIERILQFGKQYGDDDPAVLKMIFSNRIDIYAGDELGAAVSAKKFDQLAEDIMAWHKSKSAPAA